MHRISKYHLLWLIIFIIIILRNPTTKTPIGKKKQMPKRWRRRRWDLREKRVDAARARTMRTPARSRGGSTARASGSARSRYAWRWRLSSSKCAAIFEVAPMTASGIIGWSPPESAIFPGDRRRGRRGGRRGKFVALELGFPGWVWWYQGSGNRILLLNLLEYNKVILYINLRQIIN